MNYPYKREILTLNNIYQGVHITYFKFIEDFGSCTKVRDRSKVCYVVFIPLNFVSWYFLAN